MSGMPNFAYVAFALISFIAVAPRSGRRADNRRCWRHYDVK